MLELPAYSDGGPAREPHRFAVWCITRTHPDKVSAWMEAEARRSFGIAPHYIYHPISGETMRTVSADREASATKLSGFLEVMVVSDGHTPFTSYRCPELGALVDELEAAGVARSWPFGPPYEGQRPSPPRKSGHYSALQVPSGIPGPHSIDIDRILRKAEC